METPVGEALRQYGVDLLQGNSGQVVEGRRVFNCSVDMNYGNSGLTSVTGRLVLGSFAAVTGEPAMDAGTALMRFIANMESSGFICTEIVSMELGYTMSAQVTGSFQLTPVWHVTADTGEYYVNAISGAVERYSA